MTSPTCSRCALSPIRLAVMVALVAGVIVSLGSCGGRAARASLAMRNRAGYLQWQGRQRYYIVHEPPYATHPMPVVFMLHGYAGTAQWSLQLSGWAQKADAQGFLAVFPEGTRPDASRPLDPMHNAPAWNDGSGRFTACWENVDDVGFLVAVLESLKQRYPVDARRVYLTGFSNGSSMAYRAAIEAPGRFAGVGAVSSSGIRVPIRPLDGPVSLIAMHGTADPMSPLEGGAIAQFGRIDVREPVIAAPQTWAGLLGLGPPQRDWAPGYTLYRWPARKDGAAVCYYELAGGGHEWRRSRSLRSGGREVHDQLDTADVMWDFFRSTWR